MPICSDDYSIDQGVSRRILKLMEDEFLCTTSVMVVFDEIDFSKDLASLHKHRNIGLHFTLTDFSPVSEPFSRLLSGRFPSFLELIYQKKYRNEVFLSGLELELEAQINRFVDVLGFEPDHIDCHHHLQFLPEIHQRISQKTTNSRTTRAKIHVFDDSLKMTLRKIILNRFSGQVNSSLYLLDDKLSFKRAVNYIENTIMHYKPSDQLIFHPGEVNSQIQMRDSLVWQRERDFALLSDRSLQERFFNKFLSFKN